MHAFLNGKWVREDQAMVSVFDRGFLYGDGLFETIRVLNGKPFRWAQHIERLGQGSDFLGIPLPFPPEAIRGFAEQGIRRNKAPDALLRITLSRGRGHHGYSPRGAENPTLVISLRPGPVPGPDRPLNWRLIMSSARLPANDPLARFKTANKLPQVLARTEADTAGADEALLLNTDGFAIEGSSSNLFWVKEGMIFTPPPAAGILPGVTRAAVLEICDTLGLRVRMTTVSGAELRQADGVFLSLTSAGVVQAVSLDGRALRQSELTVRIHDAYETLLGSETV